jgi:hypothetical protein
MRFCLLYFVFHFIKSYSHLKYFSPISKVILPWWVCFPIFGEHSFDVVYTFCTIVICPMLHDTSRDWVHLGLVLSYDISIVALYNDPPGSPVLGDHNTGILVLCTILV